eukprot:TRINITY_DN4331_c0_g1_i1.p1 TRINITY_DN4331_c0_g1~~TRINITY_DN4331_c0_g1_i1.p1  ORF type:complete len:318 (-),score=55.59 TRINITY_DN4331_c0_g1_i1:68-1021(-)
MRSSRRTKEDMSSSAVEEMPAPSASMQDPSAAHAAKSSSSHPSNHGADEDVRRAVATKIAPPAGVSSTGVDDDLEFRDNAILGTKDLPVVGAAGVLVPASSFRPAADDAADASTVLELQELNFSSWGPSCTANDTIPSRLYQSGQAEKRLTEYLTAESAGSTAGAGLIMPRPLSQIPQDMLQVLASEQRQVKPAQGPSILQLAKDPKRREECPACAAEWARTLEQLQQQQSAASGVVPQKQMRRAVPQKVKMHSIRCHWLWFQQSLCSIVRNLRFDENGDARGNPPLHTAFPPAMFDAFQFWKSKPGKRESQQNERA